MIRAIIFDLDNTLIDFRLFKRKSCEAAVGAMIKAGLKTTKKQALKQIYLIYDKQGIEDPLVFQRFLKKTQKKIDYKILGYGINAYRKARIFKPYKGTEKTLKSLKKKYKLAIVSDAPRIKTWIRLTAMNIDKYFDVVISFEDTGKEKPSTEPFKAALKRLKVKPEECLMVGDNPHRDIAGAKKLGMKTCLALYGRVKKSKEKADFEINKIEDIIKLNIFNEKKVS
jgi:HAD superfamily hydrolase (TIGR02253 family)